MVGCTFAKIEKKYQAMRDKAGQDFPGAYYLSQEIPKLEQQIAQEVEIYDLESRVRLPHARDYLVRINNAVPMFIAQRHPHRRVRQTKQPANSGQG